MNATATATATDLATLDRAALRTMYRTLCAEQGVEIDRTTLDKATALRTAISAMLTVATEQIEAEQVEAEVEVEVEAEIEVEPTATEPTAPVDALFAAIDELDASDLLAMVEQQVAAATGESKKREMKATAKFTTLLCNAMGLAMVHKGDDKVLDAQTLLDAGWSKAYTTMRNGWGKSKPGGLAAAALGYTCTTRADKTQPGGFVVVLAVAA